MGVSLLLKYLGIFYIQPVRDIYVSFIILMALVLTKILIILINRPPES